MQWPVSPQNPFHQLLRSSCRSFMYRPHCARSVLPRTRANIPQYGPRTWLEKKLIFVPRDILDVPCSSEFSSSFAPNGGEIVYLYPLNNFSRARWFQMHYVIKCSSVKTREYSRIHPREISLFSNLSSTIKKVRLRFNSE